MKILRHLLLALFFLGLTALEITHGVSRLDAVREDRHREILLGIERGHNDLAREVRGRLESEREHAAYLSRLPAVRELLKTEGRAPQARRRLEAYLLPYLVSFRGIDRVRVLDRDGSERFRCERIGKGVGGIPLDLIDPAPDQAMLTLTRDAQPGEVVLSDLGTDRQRVEVPESERQVLHFGTLVDEGNSRLGILVLTVYAAPLLNAVRGFTPIPGVHSLLVSRDGSYLASTNRSQERGSPSATNLRDDYPAVAEQILSGVATARSGDTIFFARVTGEISAPWRLVTAIPNSALDEASRDLKGEYAWVIGSMLLATLVLIAVGVFLIRMSVREFRLREAARYEQQQKQMERQMQVAERLGSLGLLTAGVAHEINNPLEGIENYLALLEKDPDSAEKRKRYVEMVRYGFHRIRDIVRDLSAFSRPGVTETQAELGEIVAHAFRMVAYTKDFKAIQVREEGLDAPVVIAGDPGRLEQVFLNLFLNAARAMKGQGDLTVRAVKISGEEMGSSQVQVSVEDTGPGLPEESLDKIFDPFFTTTDGTGLGLSISYGIIRAHGGTLEAQNREEGGARFVVRLPVVKPAVGSRHGTRSIS